MVVNLVNDTYAFSSGIEDIRITDVHDKLTFRLSVDGREVLSEGYYPDGQGNVTIGEIGELVNEHFTFPALDGSETSVALPPMEVKMDFADSLTTAEYRLNVIHARHRVSFEPQTDFVFYSRYKIKHLRQNSIDFLSFYVSDHTQVYLDVTYLTDDGTVRKRVPLQTGDAGTMTACNLSPVKVAGLAGVQADKILSYDARITNGTLSDLVRYIVDRSSHREMHQFLYYNVFGLPESVSFSGLVQYAPALEGEIAEMVKKKRRISPRFEDIRTINTGYLDENKYKAVIDMLTSPAQRWYDTQSTPMEILITDIDFTHTKMGNHRVNVNLTFRPADRKHRVFDRFAFTGGIFDYTFDKTFE